MKLYTAKGLSVFKNGNFFCTTIPPLGIDATSAESRAKFIAAALNKKKGK